MLLADVVAVGVCAHDGWGVVGSGADFLDLAAREEVELGGRASGLGEHLAFDESELDEAGCQFGQQGVVGDIAQEGEFAQGRGQD